jgi:hypothetical protein
MRAWVDERQRLAQYQEASTHCWRSSFCVVTRLSWARGMRERQAYGLEQMSNNEQYMGILAPLSRSHEDTQDQSQLQVRL